MRSRPNCAALYLRGLELGGEPSRVPDREIRPPACLVEFDDSSPCFRISAMCSPALMAFAVSAKPSMWPERSSAALPAWP